MASKTALLMLEVRTSHPGKGHLTDFLENPALSCSPKKELCAAERESPLFKCRRYGEIIVAPGLIMDTREDKGRPSRKWEFRPEKKSSLEHDMQ